MELAELNAKITDRTARLAVIGLGYVGLPVACTFADEGFDVLGVELRQDRVEKINAGCSPIEGNEPGLAELIKHVIGTQKLRATTDYAELQDRDVILIDVETPVNSHHEPEYEALRAVCNSLGPVLKQGALVIVESTLAPGTVDQLVRQILEEASGRRSGVDFFLGVCPERVMPGKLLSNLRTMSRVCGGETAETAEVMVALYRQIVDAELDPTDCITAELVKTTENAYRDVNIAFANEVALICEAVGGDVWKVRELVNKSPGRNMLYPGAGVGGHCIPKDPWLLAYGARGKAEVSLIPTARSVNDSMPLHMVKLLKQALSDAGITLKESRIAVLGYAYLENSDDTRNSPTAVLVEELHKEGAEVVIHDPYVMEYRGEVMDVLEGADAVVIMIAHDVYRLFDFQAVRTVLRAPIVIDGRRLISAQKGLEADLVYLVVGTANYRTGAKFV